MNRDPSPAEIRNLIETVREQVRWLEQEIEKLEARLSAKYEVEREREEREQQANLRVLQ